MRVLGIDLAWGEGSAGRQANETGVVAVDGRGVVLDAGWTCGLDETAGWIAEWCVADCLAMIDAPLVVENDVGQRFCEKQVGQRYGRWKVSANSTNRRRPRLAGVALRTRLDAEGWRYDDGSGGPSDAGRALSEVYPYTTIVGADELGDDTERPTYKRPPRGMSKAQFRPLRALACNGLITAMMQLTTADPALDLRSHPATAKLVSEVSPLADAAYKHREDLLDAALCAWTGLLWVSHGLGAAKCSA